MYACVRRQNGSSAKIGLLPRWLFERRVCVEGKNRENHKGEANFGPSSLTNLSTTEYSIDED